MSTTPGEERNRRQRWTLAEVRYVEQHYGTVKAKAIAEHLGRPGNESRGAFNQMIYCRMWVRF
jgi:hypothetical protein